MGRIFLRPGVREGNVFKDFEGPFHWCEEGLNRGKTEENLLSLFMDFKWMSVRERMGG